MKTLNVAALALNIALYVAFGVLLSSVFPLSFEGVRFWPQVIIPAIFAVIFGPWVGGIGAGVGIFLNDVILGNNPLLSLMAGVTSNFAAFWLIGYIANKKTNWVLPTVVYGIITAVLAAVAYIYTSLLSTGILLGCFVIFLVVVLLSSKYRSYEVGSVVGLLVGSAIIAATVPLFSILFLPPESALAPFTLAGGLALFVWTFATEIPFLLALGPPIIEAVKRAFPNLSNQKKREKQ